MLRCGLIGAGSIGKIHLRDALYPLNDYEIPVRLEACFDLCEENLEKVECERKYTNLDEFFENEKGRLDFVDICLPTFMHKEFAERAMQAGFDVLCEKPMALYSEDAMHMCAVASETGRNFMIAHVLRFDKEFIYLHKLIKSEKLGKVRNVHYTTYGNGLPKGQNNWFRDKKLSGGPVLDIHIHDTDLILWLFGKPDWVSTTAVHKNGEVCLDSFSSNMRYGDGMYISIQCDWENRFNFHQNGRFIRINCEKGYIIKTETEFFMVDSEGNEINLKEKDEIVQNKTSMYYNEVKYFVDCLSNKTTSSVCCPCESAMAVKLIEAEIASAKAEGEKIKL